MAGLIVLAGASLIACNRDAAGGAESGGLFDSKVKRAEDKFGEGFGNAFRADPNSEPVEVSDADIVPVTRTAEPVPIN